MTHSLQMTLVQYLKKATINVISSKWDKKIIYKVQIPDSRKKIRKSRTPEWFHFPDSRKKYTQFPDSRNKNGRIPDPGRVSFPGFPEEIFSIPGFSEQKKVTPGTPEGPCPPPFGDGPLSIVAC